MGVNFLVADNQERSNQSLRTFINLDVNRQMIWSASIVVVDPGLNFGLAKSVGDVHSLEISDVALEQGTTVASMGKESGGGLNAESHAEHLPGEILVSRNIDEIELVYSSGIDAVDDAQGVGSGFLAELDGGVEVTTTLKIVEQVALALIQKIVVQSVFFIDWDFSFQHSPADVKTLSIDDNHRPGLD